MIEPVKAIKLSWAQVSDCISEEVSKILGRRVVCDSRWNDYCYWAIDVVSLEDLHEDNYPVVEDEWMNHLLLQEDDFNFEQERLANAYAQLPLLRKQILKLLFVRDLKVKEIAKMLNCSPNFVSDQKRRALEALRRKLDEGGDENG